ncbi:hypothetical protein BT67DRAFT_435921 [Trichocladium antarcticum]|uniref:Uncharacterized protein n=1 Tax=Trichocladium antarcticum TaxID=1450529 RepID=A0AAN6UFH5_9PEZI|nr:hypothetical protein BT67DRAFT_435921 [Trichocladium antarcticum]
MVCLLSEHNSVFFNYLKALSFLSLLLYSNQYAYFFKRLVSILTEGDNTSPAGPAANEQQENSAAAAAAAATAAAALAALPDLEPDPIYKTNIVSLLPSSRRVPLPLPPLPRKKKKKEDANELGLS